MGGHFLFSFPSKYKTSADANAVKLVGDALNEPASA